MTPQQDPLFKKCMAITSMFEGAHYDTVVGDFDGQFLSCGRLCFTFTSGSLKQVIETSLQDMAFRSQVMAISKDIGPLFLDAVTSKKSSLITRLKAKAGWKSVVKKILSLDACVMAQDQIAKEVYFARTEKIVKNIKKKLKMLTFSEKIYFFIFDMVVQCWSFPIDVRLRFERECKVFLNTEEKLYPEQVYMTSILMTIIDKYTQWRKDVFCRKRTIILGHGEVHGKIIYIDDFI